MHQERFFVIKNKKIIPNETARESFKKTLFLRAQSQEAKGWTLDVMNCIDAIKGGTFKLSDVYQFEASLKSKYPHNNSIKDKIRQQLQFLRDKGIITFLGRGHYKKRII